MAVQSNPPIQIDPNMGKSHQWAFANQNFTNIADTLQKSSFLVVDRGTTTISSDGSTTSWTTVAHNLGFVPQVIAFLNNVTLGGITTNANIPLPTLTSGNIDTVAGYVKFATWVEAVTDDTNLYIVMYNATGAPVSALTVKYYLLQEPAN